MRSSDEHRALLGDTSRPRYWCLSAPYRVALALLLVSVVGCGDDGDASGGATTSAPIPKPAAVVRQREDQNEEQHAEDEAGAHERVTLSRPLRIG